jgi:RNA polymerase sigma-70 factor (ECF subfamily)
MADDVTRSLDLVLRAQEGDRDALNRLCERYYDRVRRVVRVRLGSKLRQVVDSGDILQETFQAAVGALENFEMREEASLINWLARLAEHQIIAAADFHGAKKRDHARVVPLAPASALTSSAGPALDHVDRSTLPLDRLLRREDQALVESCLERLEPEYKELIILRHYVGASWETVAEETGRPSAAAARMMHARAVIELGKLLREAGVGEE